MRGVSEKIFLPLPDELVLAVECTLLGRRSLDEVGGGGVKCVWDDVGEGT